MSDWEMQPRIKPKPGAQGTLFHGGSSQLNPVRRWPRGYSPGRQAEVRKALEDTRIEAPGEKEVSTTPEEQARTDRSHRFPQAEAQVVDTIARSTIPVEHLKGLGDIDNDPGPDRLGEYHQGSGRVAVEGLGSKGDTAPETLIHELGHHVDFDQTKETSKRVMRLAPYGLKDGEDPPTDFGKESGTQEAVADNYYKEHYRTRGRVGNNKAPSQGHYESTFTPEELDADYPGYREVSITNPRPNLNEQQFEGLF